ncbi:uncharacterized protein [Epargyreus clarus]|uniref:uncharacterized protein isoform X2 n=1 Tax=Epargyreus clarus TaxID=520877 RepID=UPI003C30AE65
MADKYDKNGYNSSDFKRNSNQDNKLEHDDHQDGEDGAKLNKKAGEYMKELLSEKIKMNNVKFPLSSTLLDQEVNRLQASGRVPPRDNKYLDVYREKPIKLTVKVLVPVKEHPKINFIGKLMGPKGNTMKHLQEETMCKMAVLGRGSMRDRQKEEELRNSLDPKYSHLTDELHVEISALAPPAEAHARIAYALAEVKKYLQPDPSDSGWQNPIKMMERAGPSHPAYASHAHPAHAHGRPAPRMPPAPPPLRALAPPKPSKVLSILDRARTAMETSYSYEDTYAQPEPMYNEEYTKPAPRGPPRTSDSEFYYERGPERFYEDEGYYKEEGREYEAAARDVGTRRPRHYARPAPYSRAPKGDKKRSQ